MISTASQFQAYLRAILFAGSCSVFTASANAEAATEMLEQCLATNVSGEQRLALMKMVVFTALVHPSMRDVVSVPPAEVEKSDREIAALFDDLILVKCRDQIAVVVASNADSSVVDMAFSKLGEIAAQELFSSQELEDRIGGFVQYLDERTLDALGDK